jgi:hypothetical protein
VTDEVDRSTGFVGEGVGHGRKVGELQVDRVGPVAVAGLASTATVDGPDPEVAGEDRAEDPPRRVVGGRAVDEDQRRAVSGTVAEHGDRRAVAGGDERGPFLAHRFGLSGRQA